MKRKSIGSAELEVLKYIADHPAVPVRQVADHFAERKGYVRPTVLKMMERLRGKGYLRRDTSEGVFVYTSVAPAEELDQNLVEDFVNGALEGSVSPMVAYLVRKGNMTQDDLQQLRALVDELDSKENPE